MKATGPQKVYSKDGKQYGFVTGGKYPCRMEGCNGHRVSVAWKNGKRTYPCINGMKTRKNGDLQIV